MADSPILRGEILDEAHGWGLFPSSPAPPSVHASLNHHSPNPPADENESDYGAWPSSPAASPNQQNNYDHHSPLDNPAFPSWSQNPNPFGDLPELDEANEDSDSLPPSNQAAAGVPTASRREIVRSQYRIDDTESPDPFEEGLEEIDWLFTPEPPPQREMPAGTHATIDLTEDVESSPPPRAMASTSTSRKRKAPSPAIGRVSKIKRGSLSSSPNPYAADSPSKVSVVDLVEVEDAKDYEALRAKEQAELIKAQNQADANKPVKLAEFQCIICMDNPTDLTVTHCGHLFCSECLHQALHAGDKKCCPVCRQSIVIPKFGAKSSNRGVYVLEMKLLTSKKKGKQVVRS